MNPPSREIRVLFVPPGSGRGESSISLRTPLTPSKTSRRFPESLVLQSLASPSAHMHTKNALGSQSFSHGGFHSLEITHSPPLITSNVSSLRDCLRYVSHDEQGNETQWRLQAVIRKTAASGCRAKRYP